MRVADIQRTRSRKCRFGSLNAGEKLIVGQEMPNCFRAFAGDSQNAKQSQTALKLKDQIVAWCEFMGHSLVRRILRDRDFHRKGQWPVVVATDYCKYKTGESKIAQT